MSPILIIQLISSCLLFQYTKENITIINEPITKFTILINPPKNYKIKIKSCNCDNLIFDKLLLKLGLNQQ